MSAARWELDALARLGRVRDVSEAIVTGHWQADAEVVDATAGLAASAAESLRRRDACRAEVTR